MSTLGIGIIGGGYWGEKLLRVFGSLQGVRVRAVCDADPKRRAIVEGDVRFVSGTTELLCCDDVDTVLVATPPSTHYALAREVLVAGKHCWVEKPLAMRAVEAHELVGAARQRGLTLFVDETFLYDPLLQQAKRWIDAGRLGRVYHLSFERLGMGRIRRDSNVWWNSAPHDLSILRYLVPADVEGVHMDAFPYLQSGIADMTVTTVRLAGGVSAHIYLSWLSPLKVASIVVVGSKGMLHYEGRFGKRALQFFDYTVAEPASVQDNVVPIPNFAAIETIAGGAEEPLALAAEAFVASIRSGVPAPSAGEYSQRVVELLEAGDQSAARRQ
ncbi:MAG: Gfo/Idh/MocA family oxidoreductase [Deltaproteobacteria bacterium]|nr:Gfo/Idh/MocA family oxidoreductase [Deltaproteobacteria bacterium]